MENIDKIYKKYATMIKNYIFFITRDNDLAEDIMQETFVVAIKQIDKFRGDSSIYTWLCSIARKILYKYTKRYNLKNNISIDEVQLSQNSTLEDNIFTYDNLKLFESLQELNQSAKNVLYLRTMENLSFKEIGMILNKSENWARVTFFRSKQKLKKEDFI